MKIYQRLEQILKFRIYSNAEISEYLKKLSLMGKLDSVAQIALFNLILTKLGEIEDMEEEKKLINMSPPVPPPPNPTEFTRNESNDLINKIVDNKVQTNPLKCPDCDMVAKTKLGLISHSRKHKNVV